MTALHIVEPQGNNTAVIADASVGDRATPLVPTRRRNLFVWGSYPMRTQSSAFDPGIALWGTAGAFAIEGDVLPSFDGLRLPLRVAKQAKPVTNPKINDTSTASLGAPSGWHALAELRRLRSLRDNWDGRGVKGANQRSFDHAEKFLHLLMATGRAFRYDAELFASGTPVLEIAEEDQLSATFQFLPDGTIATLIDKPGDEWGEDLRGFDGSRLPREILERMDLG